MAAKIGVVLKAGAGTHITVAIDPLNIGMLVYTVASSLNFRGMSEIFDEKVHSLYQSIMLNCFYTGQTIKEVVGLMYTDMERVLESSSLLAETTLSVFKSVDDTFDDYVPGYSGFKKNDSGFWLLKETYYSLQRRNAKTMVRNAAIKMVREVTRYNRWRYATWQIKANLIVDMCSGSGGWVEFAEEDKEDAIMQVVRTFRHAAEANKVEASLARQNKFINSELDGKQLSDYQTFRSGLK